MKELE
jgi:hypothetical protein